MDGVIDPDVFRHSVLRSSSSCHVNLTPDGTCTELFPGAGEVCFRYDLLGFVVNLKMDHTNTHKEATGSPEKKQNFRQNLGQMSM